MFTDPGTRAIGRSLDSPRPKVADDSLAGPNEGLDVLLAGVPWTWGLLVL